jgi:hypothetical protein
LIHKPLPSIPHDVSFTVHWLAIEGVQPRIIQNPTKNELLIKEFKVVNVPVDKDAPKVKEILTKVLPTFLGVFLFLFLNRKAIVSQATYG